MDGFADDDAPLSYKFYYYLDELEYKKERIAGKNEISQMYKNTLKEFSNSFTLTTYLPRGYNITNSSNNLDNFKVLILISVSDNIGGITNVTKTV